MTEAEICAALGRPVPVGDEDSQSTGKALDRVALAERGELTAVTAVTAVTVRELPAPTHSGSGLGALWSWFKRLFTSPEGDLIDSAQLRLALKHVGYRGHFRPWVQGKA